MRSPEFPPLPSSKGIASASKTESRSPCDPCTNAHLGVCLDKCGMYGTPEEIRAVISFLERSDLVRTDKVEEYVIVAITDAGERVAEGKQIVDGVAHPTRK